MRNRADDCVGTVKMLLKEVSVIEARRRICVIGRVRSHLGWNTKLETHNLAKQMGPIGEKTHAFEVNRIGSIRL
jgi:hypothetical protein